jgi:hypothetical protein
MAGYRKKNADGPNSEDKALDLFAEMMIEKIEGIQKDWKKPCPRCSVRRHSSFCNRP